LIIEKERRIPFMDSGQIFRLDAERPGGVTPQSVVTSRDDSMKILYKRLRPVNVALFYFKKAFEKARLLVIPNAREEKFENAEYSPYVRISKFR